MTTRILVAAVLACALAACGQNDEAGIASVADQARRLEPSHPFVRDFIDAFEVEPLPWEKLDDVLQVRLRSHDGTTLGIIRKKRIRLTENGQFAFDVAVCQRKVEAASACADSAEFLDATYVWSMTDIAPGKDGLRYLNTDRSGVPTQNFARARYAGLLLRCADQRRCIEARTGQSVEQLNSAVLPCGDDVRCMDKLLLLAMRYENFDVHYSEVES